MQKRILTAILILISYLNAFADGFMVIPGPNPLHHPFPLEVVYHNVDVEISGQTALTQVDQVFYNPSPHRLEGFYIFPIPKGAVINDFTMEINGKDTKAELLEAEKARKIYEDIVRQMRDPALLEYSDQNIFKLRIFPIEPRSEKKVTISYSQVLVSDNNLFEYLYPLNTEKFSARPLKNVSININLQSDEKLKNVYCPTHEVDIVYKSDTHSIISYEEQNVKPDIDFKLYFTKNSSSVGLSVLNYQNKNDDGYFFLSAFPSFDIEKSGIEEKDITFIVDVSGSMFGNKIEQAKNALRYCISNLNENDKFDIIRFSTEAYGLFHRLESANKINLRKAEQFIDGLKSVGGTNIQDAFKLAFKNKQKSSRPHFIIFLTDGKPTIGEIDNDRLLDKIKSYNTDNSRIFTFGIGNEINTHLLDKITEETKAWRTYIGEDEDIEIKVSGFYDKIQSPVLSDLRLEFDSNIEVFQTYPKDLPDLFKGSNLLVFGRYKGTGTANIKLNGNVKGQRKEYSTNINFIKNEEYSFIPPIWASRRIGYLLDRIRLNGESNELVEEVTILAREHGIITPYTSYLILEDEEIRSRRNILVEGLRTLPSAPELINEMKGNYSAMKEESGERSITTSKEFQNLNNAFNFSQMQQGYDRMNYKDSDGNNTNLVKLVKNISGRAVYKQDKFWIDIELQNQSNARKVRIQFNSEDYFDLLNKEPEAIKFLALGQNVRFFHRDTYYEIFE